MQQIIQPAIEALTKARTEANENVKKFDVAIDVLRGLIGVGKKFIEIEGKRLEIHLPALMTYRDAEKAVVALGNGWRIPTREELLLIYTSRKEIGGFNSGSDNGRWYWSSTEHRDASDLVYAVDFSDGDVTWVHKDFHRLSCRAVRAELPTEGR